MIDNYRELQFEIDMLEGNINRMAITKDFEELKSMYKWAKDRIDKICAYRMNQLLEGTMKNNKT